MKLFLLNDSLRKKFSTRKTIRLAKYFLISISIVALLAPLICNEKPLYVKYQGENLFPAPSFQGYADIVNQKTKENERLVYSTTDWYELKKEKVIWCLIPFSAGRSDWTNSDYKSPSLNNKHWLGTTKTGADVLSGIIHGARVSLTVGFFSMLIAGLIGIALGAAAGFFGDHKILVSKTGMIFSIVFGLPLSYFYGIYLKHSSFTQIVSSSFISIIAFIFYIIALIVLIVLIFYFLGKFFGNLLNLRQKTFLHVDQFVSRGIEIFNSIPRIILIITLSAIARPSVQNLVLIIGLTSWTEIARLVRAEMLRVRESEYIQSATASGIKTARLILRHALPNVITPALTAITLGVATAILAESALSFLGIGVPADVVTWGSLLNEGRQNFSAWWLVVFPGIAIFTTVSAINILGDALGESIDPKNK